MSASGKPFPSNIVKICSFSVIVLGILAILFLCLMECSGQTSWTAVAPLMPSKVEELAPKYTEPTLEGAFAETNGDGYEWETWVLLPSPSSQVGQVLLSAVRDDKRLGKIRSLTKAQLYVQGVHERPEHIASILYHSFGYGDPSCDIRPALLVIRRKEVDWKDSTGKPRKSDEIDMVYYIICREIQDIPSAARVADCVRLWRNMRDITELKPTGVE